MGSRTVACRYLLGLLSIVGVLLLSGCLGGEEMDDPRLRVVTTTGMITDLVERVGGERVLVQGLMGPGIDPHLYKASAGDVRLLSSADLIFYNGLHLEAAMAELLQEMDGRIRTRAVTDAVRRDELLSPPDFQGQYDPHLWFDVRLWGQTISAILKALVELDPEGELEYQERADALLTELDELESWVRGRVAEIPEERRVLITAHDAFNYFGRAYGFRVEGLQGLSTVSEAGTGDVQRLAALILDRGIPAIFVESSIPRRNVEAVQAAVRARGGAVEIGGMLYSDAMGSPGTEEGSYIGMVRHNVNTIVDALLEGI